MYRKLFKRWKTPLGFAAFTLVMVLVLFSGENSLLSRLTGSFGAHDEVAAPDSVATESMHPADIPVITEPQANEGDEGFVDDEELVDGGEGADPTPPEESIGGTDDGGDENASDEDNGFNGEQVIIVNPGAPQPG